MSSRRKDTIVLNGVTAEQDESNNPLESSVDNSVGAGLLKKAEAIPRLKSGLSRIIFVTLKNT